MTSSRWMIQIALFSNGSSHLNSISTAMLFLTNTCIIFCSINKLESDCTSCITILLCKYYLLIWTAAFSTSVQLYQSPQAIHQLSNYVTLALLCCYQVPFLQNIYEFIIQTRWFHIGPHLNMNGPIELQFCTCHGSACVMTSVNL